MMLFTLVELTLNQHPHSGMSHWGHVAPPPGELWTITGVKSIWFIGTMMLNHWSIFIVRVMSGSQLAYDLWNFSCDLLFWLQPTIQETLCMSLILCVNNRKRVKYIWMENMKGLFKRSDELCYCLGHKKKQYSSNNEHLNQTLKTTFKNRLQFVFTIINHLSGQGPPQWSELLCTDTWVWLQYTFMSCCPGLNKGPCS